MFSVVISALDVIVICEVTVEKTMSLVRAFAAFDSVLA